jgi:serine protease Do
MGSRIPVLVICLSMAIGTSVLGQRRTTSVSVSADQVETTTAIKPPAALVYVMQTIDLSEQLGDEANILTLDGEPLSPMRVNNITLGMVIDDQGHIATRLVGISPKAPPESIVVTPQQGRPTKARFLGLDTATGLSILEVTGDGFSAPGTFSKETAISPRQLRIFGFNPAQAQNQSPSMGFSRPRIHSFLGRVGRAVGDFRYRSKEPLFRLISPKLTPIQDCSMVVDSEGAIFGIALTDTTEEGQNLIFPASRLKSITDAIVRSKDSLAHGWLGATGVTMYASIASAMKPAANQDLGVRVTSVVPDSPADKAGVRPLDIILAVDDRTTASVEQLSTTLKRLSPGNEISLRLKRANEIKVVSATLVAAPTSDAGQQPAVLAKQLRSLETQLRSLETKDPQRPELETKVKSMRSVMASILGPAPVEVKLRVRYGIEVEPLSTQLLRYFAVSNGLLVTSVAEDRGATGGLRAGDVIVAIGNVPLNDAASLLKSLDVSSDQPLVLAVSRQREQVQITLARDLP